MSWALLYLFRGVVFFLVGRGAWIYLSAVSLQFAQTWPCARDDVFVARPHVDAATKRKCDATLGLLSGVWVLFLSIGARSTECPACTAIPFTNQGTSFSLLRLGGPKIFVIIIISIVSILGEKRKEKRVGVFLLNHVNLFCPINGIVMVYSFLLALQLYMIVFLLLVLSLFLNFYFY